MTEDSPDAGDSKPSDANPPRRHDAALAATGGTVAKAGQAVQDVLQEEAENSGTEGADDDAEDAEEEDEPKLKYGRLTGHLGSLYRNGDATSSFLVAGDKMVGCKEALKMLQCLLA